MALAIGWLGATSMAIQSNPQYARGNLYNIQINNLIKCFRYLYVCNLIRFVLYLSHPLISIECYFFFILFILFFGRRCTGYHWNKIVKYLWEHLAYSHNSIKLSTRRAHNPNWTTEFYIPAITTVSQWIFCILKPNKNSQKNEELKRRESEANSARLFICLICVSVVFFSSSYLLDNAKVVQHCVIVIVILFLVPFTPLDRL